MSIPSNAKMYENVKKKIYIKYPKHSAYRSGLLVQAYKKEFSKVNGNRKSPYKNQLLKKVEDWIDGSKRNGYQILIH